MNITNWLLLIGTTLTMASLTWCACAWWYGRRLRELQQRLLKTRQTAGQFAAQSRRQIAQLQHDLAAMRSSMAAAGQAAAPVAPAQRPPGVRFDDDAGPVSRLPVHGFADTQPA